MNNLIGAIVLFYEDAKRSVYKEYMSKDLNLTLVKAGGKAAFALVPTYSKCKLSASELVDVVLRNVQILVEPTDLALFCRLTGSRILDEVGSTCYLHLHSIKGEVLLFNVSSEPYAGHTIVEFNHDSVKKEGTIGRDFSKVGEYPSYWPSVLPLFYSEVTFAPSLNFNNDLTDGAVVSYIRKANGSGTEGLRNLSNRLKRRVVRSTGDPHVQAVIVHKLLYGSDESYGRYSILIVPSWYGLFQNPNEVTPGLALVRGSLDKVNKRIVCLHAFTLGQRTSNKALYPAMAYSNPIAYGAFLAANNYDMSMLLNK